MGKSSKYNNNFFKNPTVHSMVQIYKQIHKQKKISKEIHQTSIMIVGGEIVILLVFLSIFDHAMYSGILLFYNFSTNIYYS